MARRKSSWLAAGATRHVERMLRALAERPGALDSLPAANPPELRAIGPGEAASAGSLESFFRRVELEGQALARLGVTPERAGAFLRSCDRALARIFGSRFRPAREQLQLATRFALYRGFYAAREDEVRRLESLARRAEEEERRRIGRELHDEAGQSLLLLRLQLEMLERSAAGDARPGLAEARRSVERIVVELRRIVAALSPAVLDRLGLRAAVRHLAARFEKTCGAKVETRLGIDDARLAPEAREVVYRVAQEALQNVAKHARASAVKVSLEATDEYYRLRIVDDGAGFDVEAVGDRPLAFGLAGMRERARLLGGDLSVRSSVGRGTVVLLRLPVSTTVTRYAKDTRDADRRSHPVPAGDPEPAQFRARSRGRRRDAERE